MHKNVYRKVALIVFFVLLMQNLVFAANVIEEIRALYGDINKLVQDESIKEVTCYTSGEGFSAKKWSIVKDSASKEVYGKSYFKGKVYFYKKRIVKAVMTMDSRAGDWTNTMEYYFYETGKAAFIFESHVTYTGYDFDHGKNLPPGPYIIERRSYYNKKGVKVKRLEKAFIASNKKSIPISFLNEVDFGQDRYYKDSDALPFCNRTVGGHPLKGTVKRKNTP